MALYWLSYRLEDSWSPQGGDYETRYRALLRALRTKVTGGHWEETTSFAVFESSAGIMDIAPALRAAIDPAEDTFLLRMMDAQQAVICGRVNDLNIFSMLKDARGNSYLKKL